VPLINGRQIGNTNRSRALRERELKEETRSGTRTAHDRGISSGANSLFNRAHPQVNREDPITERTIPARNPRFTSGLSTKGQFYPHSDEEMDDRIAKIHSAFMATYGTEPDTGLLMAMATNPRIPTEGMVNAFPMEAREGISGTQYPEGTEKQRPKPVSMLTPTMEAWEEVSQHVDSEDQSVADVLLKAPFRMIQGLVSYPQEVVRVLGTSRGRWQDGEITSQEYRDELISIVPVAGQVKHAAETQPQHLKNIIEGGDTFAILALITDPKQAVFGLPLMDPTLDPVEKTQAELDHIINLGTLLLSAKATLRNAPAGYRAAKTKQMTAWFKKTEVQKTAPKGKFTPNDLIEVSRGRHAELSQQADDIWRNMPEEHQAAMRRDLKAIKKQAREAGATPEEVSSINLLEEIDEIMVTTEHLVDRPWFQKIKEEVGGVRKPPRRGDTPRIADDLARSIEEGGGTVTGAAESVPNRGSLVEPAKAFIASDLRNGRDVATGIENTGDPELNNAIFAQVKLQAEFDNDLGLLNELRVSKFPAEATRGGQFVQSFDPGEVSPKDIIDEIQDVRLQDPLLGHSEGTAELMIEKGDLKAQVDSLEAEVRFLEANQDTGMAEAVQNDLDTANARIKELEDKGVPDSLLTPSEEANIRLGANNVRVATEALTNATSIDSVGTEIREAVENAGEPTTPTPEEVTKVVKRLVVPPRSEEIVADRVFKHLTRKETKKKTDTVVEVLTKIAKENLPSSPKAPSRPAIDIIREMFNRDQEAFSVYDGAKAIIEKKFKDEPEALEAIEDAFDEFIENPSKPPITEALLTKSVREELKSNGKTLIDIVKQSVREQATTREEIIRSMVSNGFTETTAQEFASVASKELDSLISNTKEGVLNRMIKDKTRGGKKPPKLDEKIAKLNRLGALDDADYLELTKDVLGLDSLTTDQASKLSELSLKEEQANWVIQLEGKLPPSHPLRYEYGMAIENMHEYVGELKNPGGVIERTKRKVAKTDRKIFLLPRALKFTGEVSRALLTTWDNSMIGRQGMKILTTESRIWAKNSARSFKHLVDVMGSDKEVMKINRAGIRGRDNFINGVYEKFDFRPLEVVEEDIPTTVLERLPFGIGKTFEASNVAFSVGMMNNKADVFDTYIDIIRENHGLESTTEVPDIEGRNLTKLVDALGSRSKIGSGGKTSEELSQWLNVGFFAIKNAKSNALTVTGHFGGFALDKGTFARSKARQNMGKTWASMATVLAVAHAMGASIEKDPRSSDFGKIRIGALRVDITGGMGSYVTFGSRMAVGAINGFLSEESDIPTGKSAKTGEFFFYGEQYNDEAFWGLLLDFAEGKSAPLVNFGKEIGTGKDFKGDPVTPVEATGNMFVPIPAESGAEMWRNPFEGNVYLGIGAEELGLSTSMFTYPDHPMNLENLEYLTDYETLVNKEGKPDTDARFQSRFQWREEFRPMLVDLTLQDNVAASKMWTKFLLEWDERNIDLRNARNGDGMSPESSDFPKELWDETIQGFKDESPIFSVQYDAFDERMLER